jgi:alkylation response protein AidB-like acyl-CoA dehydrogenase
MDHERVARVELRNVEIPAGQALNADWLSPADAEDILACGRLLRAAEMVGGMEQVVDMTVAYVSARRQFGRPIGTFQAVQHACADIRTELDAAHLATWEALSRADRGLAFRANAAVACFAVGRAFERVVSRAAQLHGGIGFMAEYPLQLYFRRAKAQRIRLGTTRFQLENVAQELLDRQPATDENRAAHALAPRAIWSYPASIGGGS